MSKLTKKATALLTSIVAATATEAGCMYIPETNEATKLVELGLIEVNLELTNDDGAAARATDAGKAEIEGESEQAPAAPVQSSFELDTDVPLPPVRRSGTGAEKYPFDQMEVGNSFHVAATEDNPEPNKRLASTVSSATARYRVEEKDDEGKTVMTTNKKGEEVPAMVDVRKFVVRAVGDDDPKGTGARVFRIL